MKAKARGFTLVELLVAVVITLVLAGIVLSVTVSTLNGWRRTQDSFTTGSQATLVLDYLERDLHSAVFKPDGQSWLAIDLDYPVTTHGWLSSGVSKPDVLDCLPLDGSRPMLGDARFGRTGAWLRLVTNDAPTTSDSTLPVVVSYQVVRRALNNATPVDAANVRYSLFRTVVDGAATFSGGYHVRNYDNQLALPDSADLLATNVVDFGVWLYARDASGRLALIYPTQTGDVSHSANSTAAVPVAADVFVRILTDEGASMISAIERGIMPAPAEVNSDDWWWRIASAHSNTFIRRVEIQGAGL
ncbi:MAG TPA: prepilin-type N-terminal cleavage/methylation domain-containing protein [Opitutus sp.]|nr:prepilin-type N-terminal cleavage/methylation domain-containing protein [Opitutus sp.]